MVPLPGNFPPDFLQQMQARLGDAFPDFIGALQQPAPVSIRYNLRKISAEQIPQTDAVPWCPAGRYLPERPVFTLDPWFHAGAYYVQEASSMLIEQALRQLAPAGSALRVLDLCAAPGGKSTLLASLLSEDSLLVSNEVIRSRVGVLRENLQRWGWPNVVITNHDPADFNGLPGFFDLVLVDAPCSGEGMFRKDPDSAGEWSLANVQMCSGRQKRILAEAVPLIRPGGLLLYSTCTYNETENQENVDWLSANYGLQPLPLDLPASWGVAAAGQGYQLYPHRLRGEGFFLACLQKDASETSFRPGKKTPYSRTNLPVRVGRKERDLIATWLREPQKLELYTQGNAIMALPASQAADFETLCSALPRRGLCLETGTIKGKDFIPAHPLALSTALSPLVPKVDLELPLALSYLRREPLAGFEPAGEGWHLATYQGQTLGWMKLLQHRINNYLPNEWRIRMAN